MDKPLYSERLNQQPRNRFFGPTPVLSHLPLRLRLCTERRSNKQTLYPPPPKLPFDLYTPSKHVHKSWAFQQRGISIQDRWHFWHVVVHVQVDARASSSLLFGRYDRSKIIMNNKPELHFGTTDSHSFASCINVWTQKCEEYPNTCPRTAYPKETQKKGFKRTAACTTTTSIVE